MALHILGNLAWCWHPEILANYFHFKETQIYFFVLSHTTKMSFKNVLQMTTKLDKINKCLFYLIGVCVCMCLKKFLKKIAFNAKKKFISPFFFSQAEAHRCKQEQEFVRHKGKPQPAHRAYEIYTQEAGWIITPICTHINSPTKEVYSCKWNSRRHQVTAELH